MSASGVKRPRAELDRASKPADGASTRGKGKAFTRTGKPKQTAVKYHREATAAIGDEDDEEARLAALVFGASSQRSLFAPSSSATTKAGSVGGASSDTLTALIEGADEAGDGDDAHEHGSRRRATAAATDSDDEGVSRASSTSRTAAGGAGDAAWHDDDDENVAVDVAVISRLRKLRETEEERVITGKDYESRLRTQFAKRSGGASGDGDDGSAPASGSSGWAAIPTGKGKGKQALGTRSKRARREADSDDDDEAAGGAAWRDDDEEEGAGAGRADGDDDDDDDDEAKLLRTAHGLMARKRGYSHPSTTDPSSSSVAASSSSVIAGDRISVSRVRDANRAEPSKAVIQAADFHPSGSVLFTAGFDHTLRFFSIDGATNPKLASVHFPDMPIQDAHWCGEGASEVLVTGRRPHFYIYDVNAGSAQRIPRILGREEKSLEAAVVQQGWRLPSATPGTGASDEGSGTYVSAEEGASSPLIAFLGMDGALILVSQRTKTWVSNLKLNGYVRAAAFAPALGSSPGYGGLGSSTGQWDILAVGSDGDVYRWDLRTMKCIARHADEGSTGGTAIAASLDGRRYAVGSHSGVVNVYDAQAVADDAAASGYSPEGGAAPTVRSLFATSTRPKPLHTSLALTTSVSLLSYSHDGGVLSMASRRMKDQMRLMHGPSGRMYGNWPTDKTPLGYVTTTAFSPHSGYIAVGNDKGRVLLYRLNHYAEA